MNEIRHCPFHSRSVKDQELCLVLHQWVSPSSHHLRNAIDGSNEDGQERKRHGAQEEPELILRLEHGWSLWFTIGLGPASSVSSIPQHFQSKVGRQNTANGHRRDLDADTCDHDVCADIHKICRFGRSNTSTGSLRQNAHDIGRDENPCVKVRLKFRVFRSIVDDEMFHRKVDASSQK